MNMFITGIWQLSFKNFIQIYTIFLFRCFSVANRFFNKHLQYLQEKRFASSGSDNDYLTV